MLLIKYRNLNIVFHLHSAHCTCIRLVFVLLFPPRSPLAYISLTQHLLRNTSLTQHIYYAILVLRYKGALLVCSRYKCQATLRR